jgi:hypothetical protein
MKPGDLVMFEARGWVGLPRNGSIGVVISFDAAQSTREYPFWNVMVDGAVYPLYEGVLEVLETADEAR